MDHFRFKSCFLFFFSKQKVVFFDFVKLCILLFEKANMEQDFNPIDFFTLPPNWKHDRETKCFTNLDTGHIFCYSGDMLCFVDAPPGQSPSYDGQTKDSSEEAIVAMTNKGKATMEMGDSSEKTTIAMETNHKKGLTKMELASSATEEDPYDSSYEDGHHVAPTRKKRCKACGGLGHNRRTCLL